MIRELTPALDTLHHGPIIKSLHTNGRGKDGKGPAYLGLLSADLNGQTYPMPYHYDFDTLDAANEWLIAPPPPEAIADVEAVLTRLLAERSPEAHKTVLRTRYDTARRNLRITDSQKTRAMIEFAAFGLTSCFVTLLMATGVPATLWGLVVLVPFAALNILIVWTAYSNLKTAHVNQAAALDLYRRVRRELPITERADSEHANG